MTNKDVMLVHLTMLLVHPLRPGLVLDVMEEWGFDKTDVSDYVIALLEREKGEHRLEMDKDLKLKMVYANEGS